MNAALVLAPMQVSLTGVLEILNQILTAGVAITAMGILMYALGFNLRDRVAQTFGVVLGFIVMIFAGEIVANVSNTPGFIAFWLRLKWAGLAMLPAAYFHFSDAILTLTGRPSRGRRSKVVWIAYAASLVWLVLIGVGVTVGEVVDQKAPMPYLERTAGTVAFGVYYLLLMGLCFYNLARTVLRSSTTTTRRRLLYLFVGSGAPALASIIFLFHGNALFARNPDFFWLLSILGSSLTGVAVVVMAYVVSFFGFNWTDRAIKSRLFRWMMRGPLVGLAVLGLTTVVRRYGQLQGNPYSPFVPIVMVGAILGFEHLITLIAPKLEKALFFGADREDLDLIRSLQDRMLTEKDLNQFLEIVAASICDRLQVSGTFIAVLDGTNVSYFITTGDRSILQNFPLTDELVGEVQAANKSDQSMIRWGEYLLMPLETHIAPDHTRLFGICGFPAGADGAFDQDQSEAVKLLAKRATLALKDRYIQMQVLTSLSAIQPEIDFIQQLRASSSYDRQGIFEPNGQTVPAELTDWVKDALTHFWGGPKLTNNPLLELKVVQAASESHDGNRFNALRAVLKQGIEQVKPEGERKFTADWLLYNILDLKFLQGKKVREVAHKLSVSEADFYRKQRVALENVARNIAGMESDLVNGSKSTETPDENPIEKEL